MKFKAYRIFSQDIKNRGRFVEMSTDELSPGELLVKTHYSSINYKDAIAAKGARPILRTYPLNGGIDVVGEVIESTSSHWKPGELVLCNGSGLSETRDGGYSEYIRVSEDIAISLNGLSSKECMVLGTAGFTAGLALEAMLRNEQTPDKGPIVVTGASGGVGSIATRLMSQMGFEVYAISSKVEAVDYLKSLGAAKVIHPSELELGARPLEKARFGGVIDNVGGDLLAGLIRHIDLFGNVASIGLADSPNLVSTVMPHILRGVNLLGISSANTPQTKRQKVWDKLGSDWKMDLGQLKVEECDFSEIEGQFERFLNRKVTGRVLVKIGH